MKFKCEAVGFAVIALARKLHCFLILAVREVCPCKSAVCRLEVSVKAYYLFPAFLTFGILAVKRIVYKTEHLFAEIGYFKYRDSVFQLIAYQNVRSVKRNCVSRRKGTLLAALTETSAEGGEHTAGSVVKIDPSELRFNTVNKAAVINGKPYNILVNLRAVIKCRVKAVVGEIGILRIHYVVSRAGVQLLYLPLFIIG